MTTNETNAENANELTLPENKVEALLEKELITPDDISALSAEEKDVFNKRKGELISSLEGAELNAFIEKIAPLLPQDVNAELWERNRDKICSVINRLIQENNRMPSHSEIARETGLSRKTVKKHMDDSKNPLFDERKEQYKFMAPVLLAPLYNKAVQGDISAMKFYFEVTGLLNKGKNAGNNVIANQHNYIQINNLKLSQEEIQKLSPEKLTQIEAFIKSSIPEGEC